MKKLYGKHVWIATLLLIAALAVFILPACAVPMIKILEPADGSEIPGGNVTVVVEVSDFELVNKLGQESVAGEGHIHYYMDAAVPTAPGMPAITAQGTYVPSENTSYTWQNVSAGMHNFSVQLVNNDHTPLEPPVLSQNTVEVMNNMSSAAASENVTVENVTTEITAPEVMAPENVTPEVMAPENVTAENVTAETPVVVAPENVTTEGVTAENVNVDLVASNLKFNKSRITVPAGSHVTINFDNQDSASHNFALYENSLAQNVIFKGEVVTGPQKTVYTFDAPTDPGTYFFRCDIHSGTMTGQFIVE